MITVLSSPQKISPVYNPIYHKISSDKTAEESFNFLFDVYVNGVFVNRDKLLPRPGTTQAIYSPARILESYVSYDLTHNIDQEILQQHCAKDYKIVFGEEYVNYFSINQIKKDTITSTSYTIIHTIENHTYVAGDSILIKDMPSLYKRYNGIHYVESIIDSKNILIRKTYDTSYPTTITLTAKTTYSDKRKTVYITDTPILLNGAQYIGNDWDIYGPDGCNVECKVFPDNKLKLIVPDSTCLTGLQTNVHQSISVIPGKKYKVKLTISAINNPSGNTATVNFQLGTTLGTVYTTTGIFEEEIIAASGINFAITLNLYDADTGTFGTHSIIISNIELYEIQPYFEGKIFNGVLSYEKYPFWNYIQEGIGIATNKPFLTKSPDTLKVELNDFGSISWLNLKVNGPEVYEMYVDVLNLSDTVTRYTFPLPNMSSDIDIAKTILHFPSYPVTLNSGIYGTIIDNTTKLYALAIAKDSAIISKAKIFEIDTKCSRYNPIQFMFLNSLGAFDYYTSTLLSKTNLNVSRDTYTKTLEQGYSRGDRGKTVINVNAQETYIANTDWISEETSNWLAYEFFLSNEVYIVESDGYLTPIIIDNNSIEAKKRVNDKLINYQFNYSKAVPVNTKRN